MPIPAELVPALRKHRADQDAEREVGRQAWHDWDLIWCGPTPIHPHDDWDEWKAMPVAAGITRTRDSTTLATQPELC